MVIQMKDYDFVPEKKAFICLCVFIYCYDSKSLCIEGDHAKLIALGS